MIKQTILLFFRNLKSNRLYYSINIAGLTIALASVLTILVYLINETSFNRNFKNSDNIYRVIANHKMAGDSYCSTRTMDKFADQLKSKYPGILNSSRIFDFANYMGDLFIKLDNSYIKQKSLLLVDDGFVDIFSIGLVQGDFNLFKNNLNGVLITQSTAKIYFGNRSPIGETLDLKYKSEKIQLIVSAIIKDFPISSTIQTGLIGKIGAAYTGTNTRQMSGNYQTFLQLKPEIKPEQLECQIPKEGDVTFNTSYQLQNIRDSYLHSSQFKDSPPEIKGNLRNLYVFSLIAILLLLVACGNYVILSNICFMTRNKEIAIKKTHGASAKGLFASFLGESILLTLLSLPFAIILSTLFTALIGNIFDIHLSASLFLNWRFVLGTFLILMITGVLGGSYIAFYLSSLKPVSLLRNNFLQGEKKYYLSKTLIVFQTISFVVLLFCVSIVYQQTWFGIDKNIGYDKENLISINSGDPEFSKDYEYFKNQFKTKTKFLSFSGAYSGLFTKPELVMVPNKSNHDGYTGLRVFLVDYNYIETAGFGLLAGRSFSESFHPEKNHIIINETAAKEFNFTNPIGERIEEKEIIGLVKDFNVSSLKETIPPVMFEMVDGRSISQILIKVDGKKEAVSIIQNLLSAKFQDSPYEISLISDLVDDIYRSDIQFITLLTVFTVLIILISSMGLFGLSVFMNNQRIKEVAIRKTFGADSRTILSHLLKDYFRVVIISILVGLPLGFVIMKDWLSNYSFQIDMDWPVFAIVTITTSAIVVFTVIFNIFKTSNNNVIVQLKRDQ
ncbi:MAG: FtsX-like permease family protein [Mariniphaga sp.]